MVEEKKLESEESEEELEGWLEELKWDIKHKKIEVRLYLRDKASLGQKFIPIEKCLLVNWRCPGRDSGNSILWAPKPPILYDIVGGGFREIGFLKELGLSPIRETPVLEAKRYYYFSNYPHWGGEWGSYHEEKVPRGYDIAVKEILNSNNETIYYIRSEDLIPYIPDINEYKRIEERSVLGELWFLLSSSYWQTPHRIARLIERAGVWCHVVLAAHLPSLAPLPLS